MDPHYQFNAHFANMVIKHHNILRMQLRLKPYIDNVYTLSDDEVQALHIEFFPEYHI